MGMQNATPGGIYFAYTAYIWKGSQQCVEEPAENAAAASAGCASVWAGCEEQVIGLFDVNGLLHCYKLHDK